MMQTERLTLRRWQESDLAPLAALHGDPEVMRYFPKPLTRTESDAFVRRIEEKFDRQGFGVWAVELTATQSFVGAVGLNIPSFQSAFTPCVEVMWRLGREHWGRGYATEAAKACLQFGFHTAKLSEIVAWTVPHNVRSRAVMERLGMTRNPEEDFDHPDVDENSALRRHVLYRVGEITT